MNAHDAFLIISSVIVTRIYVAVRPRVRRAYAKHRHNVWSARVRYHRDRLRAAIAAGEIDTELLVEADLNFALRRQAKWWRRAR